MFDSSFINQHFLKRETPLQIYFLHNSKKEKKLGEKLLIFNNKTLNWILQLSAFLSTFQHYIEFMIIMTTERQYELIE